MSMTDNEAKSCIQGKLDCMNKCDVFDCKNTDECDSCGFCYSQGNFGEQKKAFEMAIQALEKQSMVNEILHELREYSAIGTIEEFKDLKEKSKPKKTKSNKVIFSHDSYAYCPHCKHCIELFRPSHCDSCGGELDWQ
jgi:hypothetical protein